MWPGRSTSARLEHIYSTLPGGYGELSGTSMAAPFVTGRIALVEGLHPDWSMAQVINQVEDTTTPDPALAGKTVSGGIVNAASAVDDTTGPRVVASSPSGTLSNGSSLSCIQLTFSEEINPSTFTTAEATLTGPNGPIAVSGIAPVAGANDLEFNVTFPTQSAAGQYTLTVGPDIQDFYGNKMDQNRNGVIGEIPGEKYTTTFTLVSQTSFQFDFGTASSPVAPGYTQVTATTHYTPSTSYGWLSGRSPRQTVDLLPERPS